MSIKIEIKSTEVFTKSGIAAKTGRPYNIREQECYAFVTDRDGKPQPYPVRARITLEDEQAPHPVGIYHLAPQSFWINRFGQIEVKPVLVPVAAALNKAA